MTGVRAIHGIEASDDDYRRSARKIRAVHRGDAAKMQQALQKLVAGKVSQPRIADVPVTIRSRIDWSSSAILGHRTPQARQFADIVADQLLAGLLTYTSRVRLLRLAAISGINRFEANLIIAAVQHRMDWPRRAATVPTRRSSFRFAGAAALVIGVEIAILFTLWQLLV